MAGPPVGPRRILAVAVSSRNSQPNSRRKFNGYVNESTDIGHVESTSVQFRTRTAHHSCSRLRRRARAHPCFPAATKAPSDHGLAS